VFVHGLGDNSPEAWRAPNGHYWPESLAEEFAGGQFWTLGYSATTFWGPGTGMALADRATSLLRFLANSGIGGRPLIFVGHSLGGLVVKALLRQSAIMNVPALEPIGKNTRGVVFIATPHSGAKVATVANALRLTGVSARDLNADSADLLELGTWYRNNAVRLGYATYSFAETRAYGMPPFGIPLVMVVGRSSADPCVQGAVCEPIDANHITICKPESRDAAVYVGVRAFIEQHRKPADNAPSALPITVTELQEPNFDAQCGLDSCEYDVPCFYIPDVFISNSSLERTVTLRIFLVFTTKKSSPRRTRKEAKGTTWWGGKMGDNDAATLTLLRLGKAPTSYIRSPITLAPQQTVQGRLAFVFDHINVSSDFGKPWLIHVLLGTGIGVGDEMATDENEFHYSLEITDVVSGLSVSIPVPGPGYAREADP